MSHPPTAANHDLEPSERLLRDVVPAEVLMADGTRHLRARVFLTDKRIQVWLEGRPPTLAADVELVGAAAPVPSHPSATAPHILDTRDGQVSIRRTRGTCSCQLPGLMSLRWPIP